MRKRRRKKPADIRTVARLLKKEYGDYAHGNKKDPFRELVYIICSTMTREDVYQRVYRRFIGEFPTLESVARARRPSLTKALAEGGLARRKSSALKYIAYQVAEESGSYNLGRLRKLADDDLENALTDLYGVGVKVARCIMLYSFARESFPVDAHCWRIARRLGWAESTRRYPTESEANALERLIPNELRFSLHVNLVSHGRKVCFARKPACDECTLRRGCPKRGVVARNAIDC